jgi:hypothetical protein
MVRLAKPQATAWNDDDDEFPEIGALVNNNKKSQQKSNAFPIRARAKDNGDETPKPPATVRRRKLQPLTDNLLLGAWTPGGAEDDGPERHASQRQTDTKPRRARVELRTRSVKTTATIPSSPAEQDEEYVSAKEEVTFIEEASVLDDTFHSCDSDDSDFEVYEDNEESEEDEDFIAQVLSGKRPARTGSETRSRRPPVRNRKAGIGGQGPEEKDEEDVKTRRPSGWEAPEPLISAPRTGRKSNTEGKAKRRGKDIADTMSKLRL